jgi:hypothetical protein
MTNDIIIKEKKFQGNREREKQFTFLFILIKGGRKILQNTSQSKLYKYHFKNPNLKVASSRLCLFLQTYEPVAAAKEGFHKVSVGSMVSISFL